jgi:hypothetical protein
VKIDARAVDHGDYILLDMRIANVDTSRYLSNFYYSFGSWRSGTVAITVSHFTPVVSFTNEYYVSGPPDYWDEHVVTLNPEFSLTRGQSIGATFLIRKAAGIHVRRIQGSVCYRGERIVGGIHPNQYGGVLFNVPVDQ